MINEPANLQLEEWSLKVRRPEGIGPHPVIFLIHGWTGDERSMWVFASRLPKEALLIAPRAPYISKHPEHGGYSWVAERDDGWSSLEDFAPAQIAFNEVLSDLPEHLDANLNAFDMIGFSQGAAFCFGYALKHPKRVRKLAGLAGFLPAGCEAVAAEQPLVNTLVFIAHGVQDETVPVARARQARELLTQAGADVRYCESETGHKLGANCFSELADFFKS